MESNLAISISLTAHSLSPTCTPSPSRALPLPQVLHFKSSTPTRSQGQGSFKSVWGTFLSVCSSPGSLRFLSSSCKKSSFKVLQLVPARSIFLGDSKCFLLVNRLYMHPSTFPKPRPRSSPAESMGIDPPPAVHHWRRSTLGAAIDLLPPAVSPRPGPQESIPR